MSGSTIKRYSADELRAMAARGESRTDVARVSALSDDDVARAVAADPDARAEWMDRVEAVMPRRKVPVSIRLDADLLDQLRATGDGWQTRVNAILRAYVEAAPRSPKPGTTA